MPEKSIAARRKWCPAQRLADRKRIISHKWVPADPATTAADFVQFIVDRVVLDRPELLDEPAEWHLATAQVLDVQLSSTWARASMCDLAGDSAAEGVTLRELVVSICVQIWGVVPALHPA